MNIKIKKIFQKLIQSKTITLSIIAGILLISLLAFYSFGILSIHKSLPILTSVPVVQNNESKENKSPTPTSSPTEKLSPTLKIENMPVPTSQWKFSNNQYEVSVSNANYYIDTPLQIYKVSFDLFIKNISITPFITAYQISDCEVTKNGNLTRFTSAQSDSFQKGILPGESLQLKIDSGFHGNDFDAAGNKINLSSDLRIKTCQIQLKTLGEPPGIPLHKDTENPPNVQWLVEPMIILFSN